MTKSVSGEHMRFGKERSKKMSLKSSDFRQHCRLLVRRQSCNWHCLRSSLL